MTTSTTHEPPAQAVARDPHWSAKMARLRARELPQRPVTFVDDPRLKTAVSEAALGLAKARTSASAESIEQGVAEELREQWIQAHPNVLAAASAVEAAESALEEGTIRLTFRALPRPVWAQLLREHPPTEAQADMGHEYNVESFPAALIAACSVDGMGEGEAQELLDNWSDADAKALFTAALLPNQTLRADLGKG
ncbi:hypothetical protein Sipo8835_23055 [Streptomyces ipomoeae]|uniref:Uncharacterized protein n=1 Tax=Streptomyces ipomoeae TaxID=103232 RepID=A0AAE9AZR4_9ACTN|nr:hypothetical protein [Streptomyces ipomoeae]TQE30874.1 hypothetical protein Sipo8835_23055 [Streptomyces ipomoeae]